MGDSVYDHRDSYFGNIFAGMALRRNYLMAFVCFLDGFVTLVGVKLGLLYEINSFVDGLMEFNWMLFLLIKGCSGWAVGVVLYRSKALFCLVFMAQSALTLFVIWGFFYALFY